MSCQKSNPPIFLFFILSFFFKICLFLSSLQQYHPHPNIYHSSFQLLLSSSSLFFASFPFPKFLLFLIVFSLIRSYQFIKAHARFKLGLQRLKCHFPPCFKLLKKKKALDIYIYIYMSIQSVYTNSMDPKVNVRLRHCLVQLIVDSWC